MEESDMLLQRSTLKIILKTKEGICATLQLHYNRDRYQRSIYKRNRFPKGQANFNKLFQNQCIIIRIKSFSKP